MTKKEFVELLGKYPDNKEIFIYCQGTAVDAVVEIETIEEEVSGDGRLFINVAEV